MWGTDGIVSGPRRLGDVGRRSKMFYTMKEVAELFKVSPLTVMNWIKKGKIRANKIGRVVRISEEEIKKLIKETRR